MNTVAFTGAGISFAAGIPGFDTHWQGIPIRTMLTRQWANDNKELYRELYQEMLGWLDKQPTKAHHALAQAGIPVITENIDMLHQKAGSNKVIELHGNLREGLVLLDDPVRNWDKAVGIVSAASKLVVVGCSLDVKPAGDIPKRAQRQGAEVTIIDENADTEVVQWVTNQGLL